MAKRRPSGDGMVRKREDGRWEGRIVVGHKQNGEPIFRYVLAKTQKELLDKLHRDLDAFQDVELTEDGLRAALAALEDEAKYGAVLRAKGIVAASEGEWIHFDYTPGEINIRRGSAGVTGRLCVIGHELHEDAVAELFR